LQPQETNFIFDNTLPEVSTMTMVRTFLNDKITTIDGFLASFDRFSPKFCSTQLASSAYNMPPNQDSSSRKPDATKTHGQSGRTQQPDATHEVLQSRAWCKTWSGVDVLATSFNTDNERCGCFSIFLRTFTELWTGCSLQYTWAQGRP